MHPRGVHELGNLGNLEHKSAEGESFAIAISEIHEHVKQRLQDNNYKYKLRADAKRREVNFDVGYLVLAHLRKERFPRGQCNKLKLKKIGPCKILRKFVVNAYELELPIGIGISQIFNIVDLYPYKVDDTGQTEKDSDPTEPNEVNWLKQMPTVRPAEAEAILEQKVSKKTRGKEYLEYLVKWQGLLEEDSTWMSAANLKKKGNVVEGLMSKRS